MDDEPLSDRIDRIAADTGHGGSWLAREAVETVVEAVRLGRDPLDIGRELVAARPAVGAIAGAVGRLLACSRESEQLLEEAHALIAGRDRAAKTIAVLIRRDVTGTVMTHSASATVREALLYAHPDRVVCTESEPIGEGRAFARDLSEAGLDVELVADADAVSRAGSADLLLLGADTAFRDGSLLNKVGTEALAEAAYGGNVPAIVACEVLKLSPAGPPGSLEDRTDLTPPELISRYVTEEGSFVPEDIASLVDRTPFLAQGNELLQSLVA